MKKRSLTPPSALCLTLALVAFLAAFAAPLAIRATPLEPFVPNVNTAPPHELILLPGVGPARAAAIIDSRRVEGVFPHLDDLQRVKGIGPRTVAGLHGVATADDP